MDEKLGVSLRAALGDLAARLGDWSGALAAYAAQVASEAARAVGRAWAEATEALAPPAPSAAQEGLEGVFDACDGVERRALALAGAAEVILGRAARVAAEQPMSRSFAEDLGVFRRAAEAATARAASAHAAALRAATAAGREAAEAGEARLVAAFDAAGGRGQLATEVYVRALVRLRAAARLEVAKDRALGGEADSPRAAAEDARALAAYHPLQAMGAAPPAFGPPRPLAAGEPPLGLALPQARLSVVYDLGPLIDRRQATEFGPLATMLAGLSLPLVERLRTIRAEPLVGRAVKAAASPAARGRWVSTDGGVTRRALRPAGFAAPASARPALLAGAAPRVGEYGAATEEIILGCVRAERKEGWGLDLRERYEASLGAAPEPTAAEEELLSALLDAFDQDYAAAPPADGAALRALAVSPVFDPRGYISRAAAALGEAALGATLRSVAVRAPRLLAAMEIEARVTRALQALEAAREVWRRLRDTFQEPDPPAEPSPAALQAAHRRAVRQGLEAALRVAPVVIAAPSLKLYAAGAVR